MNVAVAKPIMIVEDDEGLSRLISDILSDDGQAVVVFNDPYRAVAEFGYEQFSLVITDVKMPGMDGIEVLGHVKRIDPHIPVIIITAHATVDVSIQALRKGADDLITKPFEAEEFLYRIRKTLRNTALSGTYLARHRAGHTFPVRFISEKGPGLCATGLLRHVGRREILPWNKENNRL